MIWRLLRPQGAIGLALCALLSVLLCIEQRRTGRWREEAQRTAVSLKAEQATAAQTLANYRAAAAAARAADAANIQRVTTEQSAINQRSSDDFEARISDARARAGRLQQQAAAAEAHSGSGGAAPMSGLSAGAQATAGTAGQDRLPLADRLTATEQALQLDALIKWVNAQSSVDPGNAPPANSGVR